MTPEEQAIRSATPGCYLQHFIDEFGTTQAQLSRHTGIPCSTINEIIKDKRRINVDVAVALGAAFGNGAEPWMRLQSTYDLMVANLGRSDEIRARVQPLLSQ